VGFPVDFLDVGIYGPVDRLEAKPTLHLTAWRREPVAAKSNEGFHLNDLQVPTWRQVSFCGRQYLRIEARREVEMSEETKLEQSAEERTQQERRRKPPPAGAGIAIGICLGAGVGVPLQNWVLGIAIAVVFAIAFEAAFKRQREQADDG
jgi:hypothetical protein